MQSSERPYLFIQQLSDITYELDPGMFPAQYVHYSVANHAKNPAVIDFVRTSHVISSVGPSDPTDEYDTLPLLIAPILAPSERRDHVRHYMTEGVDWKDYYDPASPEDDPEYPDGFIPKLADGEPLYVWIMVGYHGTSTIDHVTSACWVYDRLSMKFLGYGGRKFNYLV
ncbi:MAG TPA: hypothetical protein VFG62_06995 [Rhodopila sp.]|jgi:hypothetical protein|nr:hypothetical protein [Rhodopila sp.]